MKLPASTTGSSEGALVGLLRRGSPLHEQGVVVGINPEMEDGLTHLVCFHEGHVGWCSPYDLTLDLEDETGLVHAVMWLAEQLEGWHWADLLDYFTSDGDFVELEEWSGSKPIPGWVTTEDQAEELGCDDLAALLSVCLHVAGVRSVGQSPR